MVDSEVQPRRGSRTFVLGTVAGVAAGALLSVAALALVPPKTPVAVPTTQPSASVVTSKTQPPKPSTGASTPTTAVSVSPGDLVTPASGSWLALVHWMPKSSNTQPEASAYARSRSGRGQTVVVVDTDAVRLKGGKKGQYAISVVGLTGMADATATCVALGLTPGGQCGRYQVA